MFEKKTKFVKFIIVQRHLTVTSMQKIPPSWLLTGHSGEKHTDSKTMTGKDGKAPNGALTTILIK